MRIALVSLNQVWENKKENLAECERIIVMAMECGTDLIIFPEMTLTGYSMEIEIISEIFDNSMTLRNFKILAIRYNVAILFGVALEKEKKVTNNAVFIDTDGAILGNYAKVHPFGFSGEDKLFDSGDEICTVNFGDAQIGLSICYDLRFPELFVSLSSNCQTIVNIASWPEKRIHHWYTLLKARAIENQIFVIGVNRTGIDGMGIRYAESSLICNPNGECLVPIEVHGELKLYEVSLSEIESFRSDFFSREDRKPEIYHKIS